MNNEARPPRLFQCSNASGAFTVNEIVEFSQVSESTNLSCPFMGSLRYIDVLHFEMLFCLGLVECCTLTLGLMW